MKRLRYILWAAFECITCELEPLPCEAVNPKVHPDCVGTNCSCQYCNTPAGHPGKHYNSATGIEWE